MGFEAACDLLWFLKRRSVVERKEKKKFALCLSRVSPLWRFTRDCLVLSSLKACRRCSSVKTGSLQCCNLMAHAAKRAAELFTGLCNPLVYPTELPGQVESRAKTLHRKCGVFFFSQQSSHIYSVVLSNLSVVLLLCFIPLWQGGSELNCFLCTTGFMECR